MGLVEEVLTEIERLQHTEFCGVHAFSKDGHSYVNLDFSPEHLHHSVRELHGKGYQTEAVLMGPLEEFENLQPFFAAYERHDITADELQALARQCGYRTMDD